MSEIKHTPGPWFVVDNSVFLEIRTSPERCGGEQIGDLCSSKYIAGHEDNPIALPNARLIAAAPELLEAAKAAEKVIDILWVSHHANRSDDALEKLRAAIVKATGA